MEQVTDPAAYRLGVHGSHCCKYHGCKYGDDDCPVKTGEVDAQYLCEFCEDDPIVILTEFRKTLPEGHHEMAGVIRSIEVLKANW